ncbi:hypothetical protein DICPUDRAFT_149465 [Dictyostelium purpureum]|uniref:ATPase AAA-type core domain-containing protein n=1 Tax=Dictyostelium purpureum TaxID=5786 RepID=F0ZDT5_DICPU|nr:uncharacterized protein DICPUDRAFT_149465 [Dictyostelium purpureum]EGC37905.1 hypothetical protein DICPUDRAFT_149465 [Dictyostelium purpureum]|eukprot:XP_003285565.1 hypothetical protein DICPUDRAFT_149465 [Dictyostelium purpureum]
MTHSYNVLFGGEDKYLASKLDKAMLHLLNIVYDDDDDDYGCDYGYDDDNSKETLKNHFIKIDDISISINNTKKIETNIAYDSKYFAVYSFLTYIKERNPKTSWDIKRFDTDNFLFTFSSKVEFTIKNDSKNIYLGLRTPISKLHRRFDEKFILSLNDIDNQFTFPNLFQVLFNLDKYFSINKELFNVLIEKFEPPLIIVGKNGAGKTKLFNDIKEDSNLKNFFKTKNAIYLKDSMILSFDDSAKNLLSGFIKIYQAHSLLTEYKGNGLNNYIWDQVNEMLKRYKLTFELVPATKSNKDNQLCFKNERADLSYEDLSSGEKVIFFLIGLFIYYKSYSKEYKEGEKFLLLLDEIESPLHAKFLQTAFFKIIDEIQTVFVVLLSTHNTTSIRVSALHGFNYYAIDRNNENKIIIKKIKSHENAIHQVSDGMLAVVDNSKLVCVEDVDDRDFFTNAFQKIILGQKNKFKNYTKLVFFESSSQKFNIEDLRNITEELKKTKENITNIKDITENKILDKVNSSLKGIIGKVEKLKSGNGVGGSSYVKKMVKLLSQKDLSGESFILGISQILGLVDGDDDSKNCDYIVKLKYYSLEMYLCSPLLLYFVRDERNNNYNNSCEETDPAKMIDFVVILLKSKEKDVKELVKNEEEWKKRIDTFYDGLSNTIDVQLINGSVQIPEIFIKGVGDAGGRGHYLFEALVRIYSLGASLQESTKLLKNQLKNIFKNTLDIGNVPKTLEDSLVELMSYSTEKPY